MKTIAGNYNLFRGTIILVVVREFVTLDFKIRDFFL